MTSQIVTPPAWAMQDLDPTVQEFLRQLARAANGGIEGGDVVSGIVNGTEQLSDVSITNIGSLVARVETAEANVTATAAASSAATGALSGSASPASAFGTGRSAAIVTNAVTVSASGGTSPYTFAWTLVSGDTFTINSAATDTTTFTGTAASSQMAVSKCTITDNVGATYDVNVSVSTFYDSGSLA